MNLKSTFFYFLYTIIAFFIFAWIFFPSQKAATILSSKLNNLSDNVEVKITKVRPGIFFTCKIGHSEIIINNKVKLVFGSMKIAPSFFSIFSDEKKGNLLLSDIVVKTDDIPVLTSMGMSEFNFNSINFEFKKHKEIVEIIIFDAKGTQCNIKVKGNVYFSDKLEETKLDLQVDILPSSSYLSKFAGISSIASSSDASKQGSIMLHISGTLKSPKIKL